MDHNIKGLSYIEDVLNTQLPYKHIKELLKNADVDDVTLRNLLSKLLHKSVETVNEHVLYSEYLTISNLEKLAESGINKKDYEDVQKVIGRIKIDCLQEGLSDQEITDQVSKAVSEMLNEYHETGRIKFSDWRVAWKGIIHFQIDERRPKRRKFKRRRKRTFEYHPGAKNPPEVLPVTIDEANKALKAITLKLNDLPGLEKDNLKSTDRKIQKATIEMAKVHSNTSDLIRNQKI